MLVPTGAEGKYEYDPSIPAGSGGGGGGGESTNLYVRIDYKDDEGINVCNKTYNEIVNAYKAGGAVFGYTYEEGSTGDGPYNSTSIYRLILISEEFITQLGLTLYELSFQMGAFPAMRFNTWDPNDYPTDQEPEPPQQDQ